MFTLRKMLFRVMGTRGNVKKYYPLEEEETRRFLARVLSHPENFASEIRKCVVCGRINKIHSDTITELPGL